MEKIKRILPFLSIFFLSGCGLNDKDAFFVVELIPGVFFYFVSILFIYLGTYIKKLISRKYNFEAKKLKYALAGGIISFILSYIPLFFITERDNANIFLILVFLISSGVFLGMYNKETKKSLLYQFLIMWIVLALLANFLYS
jgi:4-amino-4-deoxy-L-arabinose transferase-like glycosyltransferase